jgi:hypothetical protein|tara:strand:+ start:381 stop:578 length:198 start_codon:yes stop_codon:yes gene_type:complete
MKEIRSAKELMDSMIYIPVTEPTPYEQCGTQNTVYPKTKDKKQYEREKSIRRFRQQGFQYEPWET